MHTASLQEILLYQQLQCWKAQLTSHRVFPMGNPAGFSPIDCVSLRSVWNTDHAASRHLSPFINTLLMQAVAEERDSIWQQRNRRQGPCCKPQRNEAHANHTHSKHLQLKLWVVIMVAGHPSAPNLCGPFNCTHRSWALWYLQRLFVTDFECVRIEGLHQRLTTVMKRNRNLMHKQSKV